MSLRHGPVPSRRPVSTLSVALAILAVAFQAFGCGMKTRPLPPVLAVPVAITDLRAESEPDGIRLTFSRPENYLGGSLMRDLNRFVIMRAEGDGPLKFLVETPVPDRERLQKPKTLSYLDQDTLLNRMYRYTITSVTDDGDQSSPSNVVQITRRWVPETSEKAPSGSSRNQPPAHAPVSAPAP